MSGIEAGKEILEVAAEVVSEAKQSVGLIQGAKDLASAHPVGAAIVGVAVVGAAAYGGYKLFKKFCNKGEAK